jgi:4-hydroxy-3-methylbut-2-enyl diphosphate reductase
MKVIRIAPRGYCPGVVRAIKLVNDCLNDPTCPRPIQVLGMIVHNRFVVEELRAKGVITLHDDTLSRLELLNTITSGTIVITAHGVSPQVIQTIRDRHLYLVDATCMDVYKTHDLIRAKLALGYSAIFIGKAGHPETEGILGIDPRLILLESSDDVSHLPDFATPILVTNQTTLSKLDVITIVEAIKQRFPKVEIADEICDSTRIRQDAVIQNNIGVDLCYIVGDRLSNNTKSLANISEIVTNTKTLLIESVDDIDPLSLTKMKTVSVSAGASTPTIVTNAVIRYLERFDPANPSTWKK